MKNQNSKIQTITFNARGITLIALIITIIVMLILVGVTISVALNGGLFGKAREGASGTQIELDKEILASAALGTMGENGEVNFEELDANLPDGFEGSNGTYEKDGITFIVDKYGGVTTKEKSTEELTALEKYILGENGEGGVELFGEEGVSGIINHNEFSFINVPEELKNNGGITLKAYSMVASSDEIISFNFDGEDYTSNGLIVDIYFVYNGATYKFRALVDTYFSSGKTLADIGVKNISYDETTRVGKTVSYDDKEWIILYDDEEHGLQMISKDALKKDNSAGITLGNNDEILNGKEIQKFEENKNGDNLNLEKAVYSYNNAVKTLNDVCDELVAKNDKITSVRSVGSKATGDTNADDVGLYTQKEGDSNTNLIKWPTSDSNYNVGVGNGKGKATDMNYEEDYDRMVALGINVADEEYWLASRWVNLAPDSVYFSVRDVSEGFVQGYDLLGVEDSEAYGDYHSCAVRPVVSLRSDALDNVSGSGAEDDPYILN